MPVGRCSRYTPLGERWRNRLLRFLAQLHEGIDRRAIVGACRASVLSLLVIAFGCPYWRVVLCRFGGDTQLRNCAFKCHGLLLANRARLDRSRCPASGSQSWRRASKREGRTRNGSWTETPANRTMARPIHTSCSEPGLWPKLVLRQTSFPRVLWSGLRVSNSPHELGRLLHIHLYQARIGATKHQFDNCRAEL